MSYLENSGHDMPAVLRPAEGTIFLRISEVSRRTGLSRSGIYGMIARNDFPRPAKVGSAAVWPADEIDCWQAEALARRDGKISRAS